MFGQSLHRLARLTVMETDEAGPRIVPYREMPTSLVTRHAPDGAKVGAGGLE